MFSTKKICCHFLLSTRFPERGIYAFNLQLLHAFLSYCVLSEHQGKSGSLERDSSLSCNSHLPPILALLGQGNLLIPGSASLHQNDAKCLVRRWVSVKALPECFLFGESLPLE